MALFYGLEPGEYEMVPVFVLDAITAFDDYYKGVDARFTTNFGHGNWQVDFNKTGDRRRHVGGLWFEPEYES